MFACLQNAPTHCLSLSNRPFPPVDNTQIPFFSPIFFLANEWSRTGGGGLYLSIHALAAITAGSSSGVSICTFVLVKQVNRRLLYLGVLDCSLASAAAAYVSTRQHTSAYVSIRQHTSAFVPGGLGLRVGGGGLVSPFGRGINILLAYVSMRQHTSEYVSICQRYQHTP